MVLVLAGVPAGRLLAADPGADQATGASPANGTAAGSVPGSDLMELNQLPASGSDRQIATNLPVLTTVDEVLQLKREEAGKGYPVRLQGVVTCAVQEHNAFILQDSTRATFIVNPPATAILPRVGQLLQVDGKTDKGSFAPLIWLEHFRVLGESPLPEPQKPTWDQLMNGSQDDQLVEIRGVVEEASTHPAGYPPEWAKMILRTTGGTLWLDVRLVGTNFDRLEHYEDAVVRLHGCLFVVLDASGRQLERGHLRMYVNDIEVEQPAPADEFAIPRKNAADLLTFDPLANAFQQVKVAGQIVYMHGSDYVMMDGTNGVRFTTKRPVKLHTCDLVEVVGYPELTGGAPWLRQADVRKTGHGHWPVPIHLAPDDLPNVAYDAARVNIEGLLVSSRTTATNQVFEIETGSWRFLARLNGTNQVTQPPPIGSQLSLTGVYVALGGNRAAGNVAPFDLLIRVPRDIKVLKQPPWWTLRRLLLTVGVLTCLLALTGLWVTQLHRQVEERSTQLKVQIQERQRVEHQRTMEQERARVAQDLHDELGSDLTEISMLAARARSASVVDGKLNGYLEQVGDKSRQMVAALDEIVWAMDPGHDTLASLVSYFCLYAERFLKLANIHWRLEAAPEGDDRVIDSQCRHQLFLVFKEALTNIVRHSGATEVRFSIRLEADELEFVITDNGQGLPPDRRAADMDGLANMEARMKKLGGRFEIQTGAGQGTTLRFTAPLT